MHSICQVGLPASILSQNRPKLPLPQNSEIIEDFTNYNCHHRMLPNAFSLFVYTDQALYCTLYKKQITYLNVYIVQLYIYMHVYVCKLISMGTIAGKFFGRRLFDWSSMMFVFFLCSSALTNVCTHMLSKGTYLPSSLSRLNLISVHPYAFSR